MSYPTLIDYIREMQTFYPLIPIIRTTTAGMTGVWVVWSLTSHFYGFCSLSSYTYIEFTIDRFTRDSGLPLYRLYPLRFKSFKEGLQQFRNHGTPFIYIPNPGTDCQ